MFSFSGWEIMIVAAMAVLVISPKDLPRAMRTVGKYVGQARRMARGFQNQLNDALREAELDDVGKEVTEIGKIDPLADVRKDIAKTGQDLKKDLKAADKAVDGSKTRDTAGTADDAVRAADKPSGAQPAAVKAPASSETSAPAGTAAPAEAPAKSESDASEPGVTTVGARS